MEDRIASRHTPIDIRYPSCERVYAEFRVYAADLSSHAITCALTVPPTSFQNAGELKTNSLGMSHTIARTGWFLSSEEKVLSKDVREHIDWVLNTLKDAETGIRSLQMEPGVTMTVYCLWWSAAGEGGPTLWPEQMQRLAQLNLEVSFDIYFYGDDDPAEMLD